MKFTLKNINKKVTDDDLIKDLKRIAQKLNKPTVNRSQYKQLGKYSVSTVRYHFGTWNNGLKKAGLRLTRRFNTTKADLFFNLKTLWLKLGREPGHKDIDSPLSEYSWHIYRHKFGSFRRALEEFVRFANNRRVNKTSSLFALGNCYIKKRKRNRDVSYSMRYKVLTRDDFRCVKCGSSPANEKGVKLQIDHIKPYSKGGETVMNNLQTLCRECNIGKGNR